ncbi:hypothetical protein EV659_11460 [Rhodothalassium salexigens DSM 2132]|uniref:Uncharacterized protein n=1 Tax=Rhodothalassium salexigens DSM 2132 TaxID=1188247 RepID=A0A4R2P8U2_RHOSA|nr:hypothetical protein [Rhodothalassium salexigens]MBB4212718.1 hypothetical protein [Rhodothalassium salexigens DSM 2132]MBK1638024.1 hypothetical protein [Rhodothalassium salexigens DSM 2132]TCP30471.1 hypothetical protein EV659_11460 [Rhodothalassium salexigens DSM 2132]
MGSERFLSSGHSSYAFHSALADARNAEHDAMIADRDRRMAESGLKDARAEADFQRQRAEKLKAERDDFVDRNKHNYQVSHAVKAEREIHKEISTIRLRVIQELASGRKRSIDGVNEAFGPYLEQFIRDKLAPIREERPDLADTINARVPRQIV